jgi:hypothetical protein
MNGRTLLFREVRGCLLLVHGRDAPGDAEWSAYVESLRLYVERARMPRLLIVTEGGAPSPAQRSAVNKKAGPRYREAKVAVITASTFARGIVMAMRLVRGNIQAFAPEDLKEALRYLDVAPSDVAEINGAIGALRSELFGAR